VLPLLTELKDEEENKAVLDKFWGYLLSHPCRSYGNDPLDGVLERTRGECWALFFWRKP
jgi:hypothetical protein